MSVWGTGNFERDDALNTLDFLINDIVQEIKETFTFDTSDSLYDDLGEGTIVANIDIVCTLCKHYGAYVPLEANVVEKWKDDFLDAFDRTVETYNPNGDYYPLRRKIIADTFDVLIDIVREQDKSISK